MCLCVYVDGWRIKIIGIGKGRMRVFQKVNIVTIKYINDSRNPDRVNGP